MTAATHGGATLLIGALGALALSCGTNAPEIPEEYLRGGGGGGDASGGGRASYPEGPYGNEPGSISGDLTFPEGWLDPTAMGYDLSKLVPISLSDFYAPEGLDEAGERTELILLNASALWCQACKVEHKELPKKYREFRPRGLQILGALFQDGAYAPAQPKHLAAWTAAYKTNFPMALDPEFQMGALGSAGSAPLNVIIDARTMKILKIVIGDQPDITWGFIETELTKRAE